MRKNFFNAALESREVEFSMEALFFDEIAELFRRKDSFKIDMKNIDATLSELKIRMEKRKDARGIMVDEKSVSILKGDPDNILSLFKSLEKRYDANVAHLNSVRPRLEKLVKTIYGYSRKSLTKDEEARIAKELGKDGEYKDLIRLNRKYADSVYNSPDIPTFTTGGKVKPFSKPISTSVAIEIVDFIKKHLDEFQKVEDSLSKTTLSYDLLGDTESDSFMNSPAMDLVSVSGEPMGFYHPAAIAASEFVELAEHSLKYILNAYL